MESQNYPFSAYAWNSTPTGQDNQHFQFLSYTPNEPSNHQAVVHLVPVRPPSDVAIPQHRVAESSIASHAELGESNTKRKRRKYDNLDWDAHQQELKKLYLLQNKTLEETMHIMKERHSFDASKKLYKLQFRTWNWSKNLPATHSHFMVKKARERWDNDKKDTVFIYGGQHWDPEKAKNSLMRNKKAAILGNPQDFHTPKDVSYKTPKNHIPSPAGVSVRESTAAESDDDMPDGDGGYMFLDYVQGGPQDSGASFDNPDSDEDHADESTDDDDEDAFYPRQRQELIEHDVPTIRAVGLARSGYIELCDMARKCKQNGEVEEAETYFFKAIRGLDQVMGPAHDDTKKVKYECASLLAETGQMQKADTIIDDLTREHVDAFGNEDRLTQQHVLHAVELLETWNRPKDAFGLLSRSKYIMDTRGVTGSIRRRTATSCDGTLSEDDFEIRSIAQELDATDCIAVVNYGLGVAKSHVRADDEGSEVLLQAIIRHCKRYSPDRIVQHLQALAELLNLYRRLERVDLHEPLFREAEKDCKTLWDDYVWCAEKFQCIEVMEAAMQLAANILKCGFTAIATRIFRRVDEKAEQLFEFDDERTVWICITIGLVYQTHMSWKDASEWFEKALAATLANDCKWPKDDGIVRSLETALDRRYFSYLSDEGRPFKTVFGVSGVTIRPGRLHLD